MTDDKEVVSGEVTSSLNENSLRILDAEVSATRLFDLHIKWWGQKRKIEEAKPQEQLRLINDFRQHFKNRVVEASAIGFSSFTYRERMLIAKGPDGRKAILHLLKESLSNFKDASSEVITVEVKFFKDPVQLRLLQDFRQHRSKRIADASTARSHSFTYRARAVFAKGPDGRKAIRQILKEGFSKFKDASSEVITVEVKIIKHPLRG